jgi:hypothetical protein
MSDWVTAAVMGRGDALTRRFVKLRDLADRSMLGSPQFQEFAALYDSLQNTPVEEWGELLKQAQAQEQAVREGVTA